MLETTWNLIVVFKALGPLWIQFNVMFTDFNFLSHLNRSLPGRLTKAKEDQSCVCSDCWHSPTSVIDWRPKLTVLLPCLPQTSFWGLLEVSRVKMSSILLAWRPWTMSSLPTSQSGSPSVKSPFSPPLQRVRTRFLQVTKFVSGYWSFLGGILIKEKRKKSHLVSYQGCAWFLSFSSKRRCFVHMRPHYNPGAPMAGPYVFQETKLVITYCFPVGHFGGYSHQPFGFFSIFQV